MRRREFMKASGALLGAAALSRTAALASTNSKRTVLPINRGWRYKAAQVAGAEAVGFDDSGFERVVVPHTNIMLPWHNFDDRAYEFISTYRRKLNIPADVLNGSGRKRVFVDFEGVMTASTVWINGHSLGEYKGGFTPFSFELTPYLNRSGENVLTVQVDSTERADIPPFGYELDYMTFGGIYREVSLRIVPEVFLDNIFAKPRNVLSAAPSLDVDCFLAGDTRAKALAIAVELREGDRVVAKAIQKIPALTPMADPNAEMDPETNGPVYLSTETMKDPARHTVSLKSLQGIQLWDLQTPHLYTVHVRLLRGADVIDEDTRRIGFREAMFTDHGFSLNGKIVKLRGLDRHQTYPFVGQAMAARGQRLDAKVLRHDMHCNIVRTSHYPQSRHFLDCCDEIGLLVLEEFPGWQHIGDEPWKKVAIDNVGRMIRRDWNHPSIILWGVRINESQDDHSFYTRTNAFAHALDETRQTGGIRYFQSSEFLEDVFTMNDFGFPLKAPNHPRYLNTEFVGHTYPTKTSDDDERQREHTLRHARIHDQLASNPQYAGGIGWCAFDYNTHSNFGAGDRICYHGVADIFREPKAAAGFYKSQCEPEEEVVLEPAFHWAKSDESGGFTKALICSNCDHIKVYVREWSDESKPWKMLMQIEPNRKEFAHLKYAPFEFNAGGIDWDGMGFSWGDLKLEGYVKDKLAISKTMSCEGVESKFVVAPDETALNADGSDAVRVVLRITDKFGNVQTHADDAVTITIDGPADLIGDPLLVLPGGQAAVWVRAQEQAGTARLTVKHEQLGTKTVEFTMAPVAAEQA